ncbi:MAG TPA: dTDP-4-amino-4,6-dideoxygalactose transaminase [Candidatus Baltobacteraceae bacterium]|nr:dTDP-4-amino-4,6-dideoxygalactose transaminase [Candidatus Baltobacteraceae bacterium]
MIHDPDSPVPFNKPSFAGNEQQFMFDALSRYHISGDGFYTQLCQQLLQRELGVPKALLTTNCTHALEMCALLLDIGPGDEVILPSFTFVSTANAFVLRGAKPIFIDIRPDTLNIDERLIETAVTPRTRAIIVVHYAGVACEMDAISAIADRHGIPIIEDNAHGLFARYKDKPLGSFGVMATQSFHETKNFTCGEGGALLINQAALIEPAEIVREKGTNRNRFFRGQIDKYTWVAPGSSYLPSDLLAAVLWAQFEARDRIQRTRREIWERYASALSGWSRSAGVSLPTVPSHCEQSYHMFYVLMPDLSERQSLIDWLRRHNVSAVFHYQPLHRSDAAEQLGASDVRCPVTDSVSDRLVRLPLFNDMTHDQQDRVIEAICSYAPTKVA